MNEGSAVESVLRPLKESPRHVYCRKLANAAVNLYAEKDEPGAVFCQTDGWEPRTFLWDERRRRGLDAGCDVESKT